MTVTYLIPSCSENLDIAFGYEVGWSVVPLYKELSFKILEKM